MRYLIVAVALVALFPATSAAQQWSAAQQEVLDHLTMCWDMWVEALEDETPARFFEACPQDDAARFWWTNEGAPESRRAVYRNWSRIREIDDDWVDIRPIHVNVFGDVAIIHLYGYWRANTPDGLVTTEYKRTEVFQRRASGWVFLGAQGTPTTPADSAPYK